MEAISSLLAGFVVALAPVNLLYCLLGVTIGTLVGVLPGIGPSAGMAILIPVTLALEPVTAIIMLAGIYYGSMYGSSTTAIMINTPGEPASVVTALEGYQLAQRGFAGLALGMAALASFVAGTLSVVALMLVAPPLADWALGFGPPETFALVVFGLTILISLSGRSLVRGILAGLLGLFLATIGMDPQMGEPRFTFGEYHLLGGVHFVSLVTGLFALPEVLATLEDRGLARYALPVRRLLPTLAEWGACQGAILRGTIAGFVIGLIPGATPAVGSFISYDLEKKVSRNPERFGTGVLQGIAGPEAANNAATGAGMVPLFTLGIPTCPPIAMLLGAFLIHGLQPGPLLFQQQPLLVWGIVASMYVGNVLLLVLNLPLIRVWTRIALIPYGVLGPLIVVFCVVGTYTLRNSMFDVWVMLAAGIGGYFMRKLGYPAAALVLAFILEPMLESAFRQSMTMSSGSLTIFVTRPVSVVLLALALVSLGMTTLQWRRQARRMAELVEALGGKA